MGKPWENLEKLMETHGKIEIIGKIMEHLCENHGKLWENPCLAGKLIQLLVNFPLGTYHWDPLGSSLGQVCCLGLGGLAQTTQASAGSLRDIRISCLKAPRNLGLNL